MSEHDTIQSPPSELPTERDHSVPAAPSVPRFEGAPGWALDVIEEMHQTRAELSASMGEFADAAHRMERTLNLVLVEVRAQGRRLDTHDERLQAGERRFEAIEQRQGAQERRIVELERRVAACPNCSGGSDA